MMNDFVNMPYFLKSPSLHIVANVLSDPNCWFTFSDSGFNHLETYEFVNGKDYPIYYGKIKFMFQTTNQHS